MKVNPEVNVYGQKSKEILLFDDGIQVRGQKEQRQAKNKTGRSVESLSALVIKTPAVSTDIVLLQKPTGEFEYIDAPINAKGEELLTLASIVKAKVIQEYRSQTSLLNLVAITDGAKAIRQRLFTIFGIAVTVILDWYHLCKKLREMMSMIATNKLEKIKHLKFLLTQLWQGNTTIALEYLKQVQARNLDKWHELLTYSSSQMNEIKSEA